MSSFLRFSSRNRKKSEFLYLKVIRVLRPHKDDVNIYKVLFYREP